MNRALLVILLTFLALAAINGCGRMYGRDGQSAAPCTVSSDSTGAFITCPDGTSTFVRNGQDGIDGRDGSQITWVDPCPSIVVPYPELLARIDGAYYAVYASGTKIHLTRLTPGAYATTDGRACSFTIGANGELQ
jgi:hypothetical protein